MRAKTLAFLIITKIEKKYEILVISSLRRACFETTHPKLVLVPTCKCGHLFNYDFEQ